VFNTYNNYGDDTTGEVEATEAFLVDSSGNLTLRGQDAGATGAQMTLHHNSASPALGDTVGLLNFSGQNASDAQKNFSRISSTIIDTTAASEDGTLIFSTMKAGTLTEAMRINESGYVGIGTTSPGLTSSWKFLCSIHSSAINLAYLYKNNSDTASTSSNAKQRFR
jgi:hypothetical protein